jgi:hypothetical protein
MKKVIFAGTYEEYVRCCHQKCLNVAEVPWITEPTQIEKINESIYPIYFGTGWQTEKYPAIERLMRGKGICESGKRIRDRIERIELK